MQNSRDCIPLFVLFCFFLINCWSSVVASVVLSLFHHFSLLPIPPPLPPQVSSLAASMRFAKVAKQQTEDARLLVVGQRINVDMPSDGGVDLKVSEARLDSTLARLAKKGQKYQTNAEDYFAVSRALFKWDKLPDFMVGGVAFDNWFVSKANRDKPVPNEVIAVDATDTIIAVHQNHGKGRKDSHLQPKSQYNRELAAKQGSWSKGRVVDTKYATMKTPWQEVLVVERRRLLFE